MSLSRASRRRVKSDGSDPPSPTASNSPPKITYSLFPPPEPVRPPILLPRSHSNARHLHISSSTMQPHHSLNASRSTPNLKAKRRLDGAHPPSSAPPPLPAPTPIPGTTSRFPRTETSFRELVKKFSSSNSNSNSSVPPSPTTPVRGTGLSIVRDETPVGSQRQRRPTPVTMPRNILNYKSSSRRQANLSTESGSSTGESIDSAVSASGSATATSPGAKKVEKRKFSEKLASLGRLWGRKSQSSLRAPTTITCTEDGYCTVRTTGQDPVIDWGKFNPVSNENSETVQKSSDSEDEKRNSRQKSRSSQHSVYPGVVDGANRGIEAFSDAHSMAPCSENRNSYRFPPQTLQLPSVVKGEFAEITPSLSLDMQSGPLLGDNGSGSSAIYSQAGSASISPTASVQSGYAYDASVEEESELETDEEAEELLRSYSDAPADSSWLGGVGLATRLPYALSPRSSRGPEKRSELQNQARMEEELIASEQVDLGASSKHSSKATMHTAFSRLSSDLDLRPLSLTPDSLITIGRPPTPAFPFDEGEERALLDNLITSLHEGGTPVTGRSPSLARRDSYLSKYSTPLSPLKLDLLPSPPDFSLPPSPLTPTKVRAEFRRADSLGRSAQSTPTAIGRSRSSGSSFASASPRSSPELQLKKTSSVEDLCTAEEVINLLKRTSSHLSLKTALNLAQSALDSLRAHHGGKGKAKEPTAAAAVEPREVEADLQAVGKTKRAQDLSGQLARELRKTWKLQMEYQKRIEELEMVSVEILRMME